MGIASLKSGALSGEGDRVSIRHKKKQPEGCLLGFGVERPLELPGRRGTKRLREAGGCFCPLGGFLKDEGA